MTDNSTRDDTQKNKKMISVSYSEWQQLQKELKELKAKYNKEKKEKEQLKDLLDQALSSIEAFEESKKNIENMFNFLKKKGNPPQETIDPKELKEKLKSDSNDNIKRKRSKEKEDASYNKCSTAHTTNNDLKYQNFKSALVDNYFNFYILESTKETKDKRQIGYNNICEPIPSFLSFIKKY